MTLPPSDMPPGAASAYEELDDSQKAAFNAHFNSLKRNTPLMVLLAIFIPIQLFLLGKIWLGILFWLTGGGLGVWWIVEWFLTPDRVRQYNTRIASETLDLLATAEPADPPADEEE